MFVRRAHHIAGAARWQGDGGSVCMVLNCCVVTRLRPHLCTHVLTITHNVTQVAEGRVRAAEAGIVREVELRLVAAAANRALWPVSVPTNQ